MRKLLLICSFMLSACVTQYEGGRASRDINEIDAAKTRISLGLTYLKNGNFTQAKFNLDKALDFAPGYADAHYSMAYYYQLVGEDQQAITAYKKAMSLAPDNADIANSYGAYLCQQGLYQEAQSFFRQAVEQEGYLNTAETYENLAICSYDQGQIESALGYLQLALNHQPSRARSLLLMTRWHIEAGNWAQAKDTLNKYEKVSRISADTLWLAAQIERGLGNTEMAKGFGQMLIRLYPEHANTQAYLTSQQSSKVSRPAPKSEKVAKQQVAENRKPAVANNSPLQESETPDFHVVQEGENLYRISIKYNILMQRLIDWNDLPNASAIYTGKKLRLSAPN